MAKLSYFAMLPTTLSDFESNLRALKIPRLGNGPLPQPLPRQYYRVQSAFGSKLGLRYSNQDKLWAFIGVLAKVPEMPLVVVEVWSEYAPESFGLSNAETVRVQIETGNTVTAYGVNFRKADPVSGTYWTAPNSELIDLKAIQALYDAAFACNLTTYKSVQAALASKNSFYKLPYLANLPVSSQDAYFSAKMEQEGVVRESRRESYLERREKMFEGAKDNIQKAAMGVGDKLGGLKRRSGAMAITGDIRPALRRTFAAIERGLNAADEKKHIQSKEYPGKSRYQIFCAVFDVNRSPVDPESLQTLLYTLNLNPKNRTAQEIRSLFSLILRDRSTSARGSGVVTGITDGGKNTAHSIGIEASNYDANLFKALCYQIQELKEEGKSYNEILNSEPSLLIYNFYSTLAQRLRNALEVTSINIAQIEANLKNKLNADGEQAVLKDPAFILLSGFPEDPNPQAVQNYLNKSVVPVTAHRLILSIIRGKTVESPQDLIRSIEATYCARLADAVDISRSMQMAASVTRLLSEFSVLFRTQILPKYPLLNLDLEVSTEVKKELARAAGQESLAEAFPKNTGDAQKAADLLGIQPQSSGLYALADIRKIREYLRTEIHEGSRKMVSGQVRKVLSQGYMGTRRR